MAAPVLWLDRCARLHWDRRERINSYRAFGTLGFAAGLAVVLAAAATTGAPHAVTVAVVVAVPLSFLLGVKISQLLFGYERIVFFEQALLPRPPLALRHSLPDEHARAGFPWYLVGRPLFSVQLVDGAVTFTAVAVAVAVARAPGALASTAAR